MTKEPETYTVAECASSYEDNRLIVGGVLAFCFVAATQLLSLDKLPPSARLAVCCFAIAIPLLCASLAMLRLELGYEKSCRPWYIWWTPGIGIIAGLVGAAATFFVLHVWAGVLFIVASVTGIAMSFGFIDRLQKLNKEESEETVSEQ